MIVWIFCLILTPSSGCLRVKVQVLMFRLESDLGYSYCKRPGGAFYQRVSSQRAKDPHVRVSAGWLEQIINKIT